MPLTIESRLSAQTITADEKKFWRNIYCSILNFTDVAHAFELANESLENYKKRFE